jgi:serine/threonine protein phosphatase 1
MGGLEHILAVGDLHGRHDLLLRVLQEVVPRLPDQTRLVFLGDYIDRGPDSAEVVDELIRLGQKRPQTAFLLGNHEWMLLQALQGTRLEPFIWSGGDATLASYNLTPDEISRIPKEHQEFFQSLHLHWQSGDYIFVHAGLRPGVPLKQQSEYDLIWIREDFFLSGAEFEKPVVFGHTPFHEPFIRPGLFGIDTGAVYGGNLTCLKLPEEQIFTLG